MIRILAIDDHPIVLRGIKNILECHENMEVTGEASTGKMAIELLKKNSYEAIILDLSLPDENGMEVFKKIRKLNPEIPVLFLSGYKEDQYAIQAIKIGAAGYLCKDSMAEVLVEAIQKIVDGGKFITPDIAEKMANYLERENNLGFEDLSQREAEVFLMMADGKHLKEIAETMGLSIKTVSTFKSRVFDKMGFLSPADLIKHAMRFHLHGKKLRVKKNSLKKRATAKKNRKKRTR